MRTSTRHLLAAVLTLAACAAGWAQEDAGEVSVDTGEASAPESQLWPIRFQAGDDAFTVYPLQLERWESNRLDARAAVAVQPPGAERPLFGVVSVSARTDIDQRSGMVTVRDIQARSASFPTAPEHATAYLDAVRRHLAGVTWQVSRERLQDDLAIDRAAERNRGEPLRNDPPRIVYVDAPTILVPIDGEPVLRDMDGLALRRVLNTRALMLQDPSTNRYFLYVAGYWLEATALDGPWTEAQGRPVDLDEAKRQAEAAGAVDLLEDDQPSRAPEVIVTTRPTELVQTDGPPQYVPIANTDLLFVSNSPNRLFLDLRTQRHYVLLAGRWYRTPSLARGPWDYVPGADLPADFAMIPDGHPTGGVRAAVPGTPQAQEATIANGVPEFATVKRTAARLEITYDGLPQFRPIEGTRLEAAVNAPVPVIRVDWRSYYALDNGVWFFSDSADGPWTAATSVPAVVYTIPRSDPLHYVTYVRVYDVTPDEVYIGYTPGYVGSYTTIGGTVVYGSGWYYRPWIGTYWYSPPVTWGFGFSFWYSWWDPWPHHVWWGGWRPVPCYRPAWGPWPYHHFGVKHHKWVHHSPAVIPAKVWPRHLHGRSVVGGGHDRHGFRAHRPGVHDIYRRWDPRDASRDRSGPRPDSRLGDRAARDRHAAAPSFRQPGDQRRHFDRDRQLDDRRWPRADAPRWIRRGDRVNAQDRAAAPRSPGLRAEPRTRPAAPPVSAMPPRSPGLLADRPGAAGPHPREFDRRTRPGSQQGTPPQVTRRMFRDGAPGLSLQNPRPNAPPRAHQQQRRHGADAPSIRSDARREFRAPSSRQSLQRPQEFRRDRTWSPPAAAAGNSTRAPSRRHDSRRERMRPSAAATEPGPRITAPPRARGEPFMRDSGRGFRSGPGFGARHGRSAVR